MDTLCNLCENKDMDKTTHRKHILKERSRISETDREEKSKKITSLITASDFFRNAKSVFCYLSVKGEPDTKGIILSACETGKKVYVPRTCRDGNMETVEIDEQAYMAHKDWPVYYCIPEPPHDIPSAPKPDLDLVLVPSLALDKEGYRLGHGAGYYDNFIAKYSSDIKRPVFAAVQFSEFLSDDPVPREKHDQKVDLIVTEEGIFTVSFA